METLTRSRITRRPSEPIEARYAHPWRFFLLATAIPWLLWFAAAWTSRQGSGMALETSVLGIAGLAAPLGVVAWMTRNQPELRRDIRARLVNFRGVSWVWVVLAAGLLQMAVFAASAISLLFGYSADQFLIRDGFTFTAGLVPAWVVLVLAPVLEELAWHSYGTDALHTRYSVFTSSMIFTVIWALWHAPLAAIQGSSQQRTVEQG